MKKLLCFLLILAMLASLMPAALAEEIKIIDTEPTDDGLIPLVDEANTFASGSCGATMSWTLLDGTLTIHGAGDMDHYTDTTPGWEPYHEQIERVVVEEGVQGIGACAFEGSGNGELYPALEEVVLADTVETVSFKSFYSLKALRKVQLGKGLKTVNSYAFAGCPELTGFILPETLETIGLEAFRGCGVTQLFVPDSVKEIGTEAFASCGALRKLAVGPEVAKIGESAFADCTALETVYLMGYAKYPIDVQIADDAFQNASATVYYPNNGGWPESKLAGYGGALSWLPFEQSGMCGEHADWTLSGTRLMISGTGAMWDFKDSQPGWREVQYGICTLYVMQNVETVGAYALNTALNLRHIVVYGEAGTQKLRSIGEYAFANCVSLEELELPGCVESIGDYAFSFCALRQLKLNEGLQTIGDGAFMLNLVLESVDLPTTLKSIGSMAFSVCSSLNNIVFRGAPPTIGDSAFGNVTATAWYRENAGWTRTNMVNYGGALTWTPLPAAPTLRVVRVNTDGVQLTWNQPEEVQQVQLMIRPSYLSEEFAEYIELPAPDFTHKASMAVTYHYRVRCKVGGTWMDWSNEIELMYNPFIDVSGKKTIEYVAWAFNSGIITGTSKVTFSPNDTCTRVQFIMMLWKQQGCPEVGGDVPFTDVSGSKTLKALRWALSEGIINRGRTFDPNGAITRAQVVMILWKLEGSPEAVGRLPFTDVTGSKLRKAVLWAYTNDITKGTTPTTFSPDDPCTRVQLVVFLLKNWLLHAQG